MLGVETSFYYKLKTPHPKVRESDLKRAKMGTLLPYLYLESLSKTNLQARAATHVNENPKSGWRAFRKCNLSHAHWPCVPCGHVSATARAPR